MIVIKIIISILIVALTAYIGSSKSRKLKEREYVLREMVTFLKLVENEIKYMMNILPNAYEIARQKRKEAFENRNKQLIADYPNFVFELGLMIQCGLNVRAAWNRLTAEYEETQHKCKGYQRYLFEEMLVTRNQIEAGVNEAAAYGAFGRRCRAHCYLKLGSSLEQNLRQGISGLEQQLDQELTQALEQRKNQAIQDGERMETKMLFPMFLLLGLVMAIVMIPAFMSM